jgi:hypothetical protein
LHPFIDKPGAIILGGRLKHATMNVDLLCNQQIHKIIGASRTYK